MPQRSSSENVPSWARPGASWGPWVFWPLLVLSIAMLVYRVAEGARGAAIAVTACQVVVFAALLASNYAARRRQRRL